MDANTIKYTLKAALESENTAALLSAQKSVFVRWLCSLAWSWWFLSGFYFLSVPKCLTRGSIAGDGRCSDLAGADGGGAQEIPLLWRRTHDHPSCMSDCSVFPSAFSLCVSLSLLLTDRTDSKSIEPYSIRAKTSALAFRYTTNTKENSQ
jgi:hypothetical protein